MPTIEQAALNAAPAEVLDLLALRNELAYDCARTDIETICPLARRNHGANWWDVKAVCEPDEVRLVGRALCYLDATGSIERDSANPNLIRVLDAPLSARSS